MTNSTCAIAGCDNEQKGRGYCGAHYQALRRAGAMPTLTIRDRFWAKVDKTPTCWNWTGHRKPDGYGRWRVPTGKGSNGRQVYVHRVAWEWEHGDLADGVQLDHRCHNTSCVRPSHLRATTPKQNQEHRVAANKGNASGVRGVTWSGSGWSARVRHQGVGHYAGHFRTIAEAEAAVVALRRKLFTHSDMDAA